MYRRLGLLAIVLAAAFIGCRSQQADVPEKFSEDQVATSRANLVVLSYGSGVNRFENDFSRRSTFGQTVTVPPGQQYLHRFGFRFNSTPWQEFIVPRVNALVYEWNGTRATGAALYESEGFSDDVGEPWVNFETGGLELDPQKQYVLVLTVDMQDQLLFGNVYTHNNNPYPGGNLVWINAKGDFSKLTTVDWEQESGEDFEFYAVFDDVPQGRVTLEASPSPASPSDVVTLTATVADEGGTPTGTVTFKNGGALLGEAPLDQNGQASIQIGPLPRRTHSLTAHYSGDVGFGIAPSTGAWLNVANLVETTTTFTEVPAYPLPSDWLNWRVAVTSEDGPVQGNVQCRREDRRVGEEFWKPYLWEEVTLDANGEAVCTFKFIDFVGWQESLVVEYLGEGDWAGSATERAILYTYRPAAALELTASPSPSIRGEAVTLTARLGEVPGMPHAPAGEVTFRIGDTILGKAMLDSERTAQIETQALDIGTVTIRADYEGDSAHAPSHAELVHETEPAPVMVSLTSSTDSTVFGEQVVLTATVTSGVAGVVPVGLVSFKNSDAILGDATLIGGEASLALSSVAVGSHSFTAHYHGDDRHDEGSSPPVAHTVDKARTTTTMASSHSSTAVGSSVTFTATVTVQSPGGGSPTGAVVFRANGVPIGQGELDGTGKAVLTTSGLAVGAYSVTAEYTGDESFIDSTSPPVSVEIVKDAVSVELVSSKNPAHFGEAITLTATVETASTGGVPTGEVVFRQGANELDRAPLDGAGKAQLVTSLSVGAHTLSVAYEGDANHEMGTSSPLTQVVERAPVAVALTSSVEPSAFGQSVTFTATVTSNVPGGRPTGTVVFVADGDELGTASLDASGVASFTTSSLSTGEHAITAEYQGDESFAGSKSAGLAQVVEPTESTVLVTTSTSPSAFGEAVTFTATVTGQVAGVIPTGTVWFAAGDVELGEHLLDETGAASLTTSELAVGTYEITVHYEGDENHAAGTSSVLTQVVEKAQTSVRLLSSLNPAPVLSEVTFTTTVAVVEPGRGTASGEVTLHVDGEAWASAELDDAGIASFTVSDFAVGEYEIEATYEGGDGFQSSSSAVVVQSIDPHAATIALSVSPESTTYGETIAVEIEAKGEPTTPSGNVVLVLGDDEIATDVLDGEGRANFAFTPSRAGTHALTVRYLGDANFAEAEANRALVVDKAATETFLVASTDASEEGEAVTFTATVASSVSGMTGEIEFFDDATSLGSIQITDGEAAIEVASLPAGEYSLRAHYRGDGNFEASISESLELIVQPSKKDNPDAESGGWLGCSAASSGDGNGGAAMLACVMLLGIAMRRRSLG